MSKNEINNTEIFVSEFIFDGYSWYLTLPYVVEYNNLETLRFDLNEMRRLNGNGKLSYYILQDDLTGLELTSDERQFEYIPFDINSGELNGKFVFNEHTDFAIDFIEFKIDGRRRRPLDRWTSVRRYVTCDTFSFMNNFYLREVTEKQKKYNIQMLWQRMGKEGLFWWDGGGPYDLYETNPKHSRGFFIPARSKTLEITYRIIIPYPSLTIENLFDKDYPNKIYSNVYTVHVDLESFFNSDSFLHNKRP